MASFQTDTFTAHHFDPGPAIASARLFDLCQTLLSARNCFNTDCFGRIAGGCRWLGAQDYLDITGSDSQDDSVDTAGIQGQSLNWPVNFPRTW